MTPPAEAPLLSPTLQHNPDLDTWLAVAADGTVTIRTGKVELGQGLRTAIALLCAEELDVALAHVRVETADTASGPREFPTVGSMSIENSGAAVRQVCAEARQYMLERAGKELGVSAAQLRVVDGEIFLGSERCSSYGEIMQGEPFGCRVTGHGQPKSAERHRYVGKFATRVDLEAKLRGGGFLHDLRLEGMLHARVLRPPSYAARLVSAELEPVRACPGVVEVVHDGQFLAVVARREEQAIAALEALEQATRWEIPAALPDAAHLPEFLESQPSQAFLIRDGLASPLELHSPRDPSDPREVERHLAAAPTAATAPGAEGAPDTVLVRATYSKPYVMHAAIGPSVAIARWDAGGVSVWSHTQGVALLQLVLAASLELELARIRVVHVAGSGCYGHNGADDAALDACLIARSVPGIPVRLQWSRRDEHQWEPYSPAARVELSARVARTSDPRAAGITDWTHEVRSNTHMGRPIPTSPEYSNFIADWHRAKPKARIPPAPRLEPHAGIHRNAEPYYRLESPRIVKHFVPETPLRVSSTRSLGAFANVFAIESFMDELAHAAGMDPLALRLAHLDDARAIEVLRAVAERIGQSTGAEPTTGTEVTTDPGWRRGRGLAFARYKNVKCYAAVAVELAVSPDTGQIRLERAVIGGDAGEIVDPDGLTNQLEGGFIQSASWTLKEAVDFDRREIRSRDWESYPILGFEEVPTVETLLFDRPGSPMLGAGEAAQGPTPAAIANALFDAVGVRVRELPLTPARVLEALRGAAAASI